GVSSRGGSRGVPQGVGVAPGARSSTRSLGPSVSSDMPAATCPSDSASRTAVILNLVRTLVVFPWRTLPVQPTATPRLVPAFRVSLTRLPTLFFSVMRAGTGLGGGGGAAGSGTGGTAATGGAAGAAGAAAAGCAALAAASCALVEASSDSAVVRAAFSLA